MNAFRPVDSQVTVDKSYTGTDLGSRGAHRNAGLDTKFYSPLIQYSWRFIAIDSVADAKFKGGETAWGGDEQHLEDAKKLYKDQSFTSDPKSAASDPSSTLIKQYSLMVYGDLGTKYGDRPGGLAHAEKELAQMGELATDLDVLRQAMLDTEVEAEERKNETFEEGLKRTDAMKFGEESDEPALRLKAAADIYDNAKGVEDKAIALRLLIASKKAAIDVGDPGKLQNLNIVADGDLGKIKKGSNSYKSIGHVDQVNMIPYGDDYGKTEDFIKFKFKDIVNNKFIIFRAILSGISDTITPEWEATRFIGRPDDVHVYKGTTRKISFSFEIYPKTKQEFPVLLEKLNFLIGLNYPSFKNNRMVAPFIELTLGDMFNNTPGYIEGVTVTPGDNSTWEMQDGLQFPKHINCQCEFTYIGKYLPSSLGKHYELPWLKDQGWRSGDNSTFTAGTFVLDGEGSVTNPKSAPKRFITMKKLFSEIQPDSIL